MQAYLNDPSMKEFILRLLHEEHQGLPPIKWPDANPATTSFTPVRHSADWIVASQNLLFRRAINGSKCYRVLPLVVFWDIDDNSRR
jgi:hypothetical protein